MAGTALQFPSHSQNRLLCASFWGYHTNYDSSAWITPPLVYLPNRLGTRLRTFVKARRCLTLALNAFKAILGG
ncbi:MAG: hypothetical protein AUJ07_07030 [Crenarchaeota archaeon 13_1_40CM_3_53_5]|nr:MAG: hypothetical protein AUJ07_07030 [Crenarchaeota archaeon 13_1_40CM_3_53_5]